MRLSKSDAVLVTGYSERHLERLEAAGVVTPERDDRGSRVYTAKEIAAICRYRKTQGRRPYRRRGGE